MSRELYVYWKLDRQCLAAAAAEVRRWHTDLVKRHPSMQARVLGRIDAAAAGSSVATLMETYQSPGGIDSALQTLIETEAAQVTAAWSQGPRHVEVFEPVGC
jgi:hypothetical protein